MAPEPVSRRYDFGVFQNFDLRCKTVYGVNFGVFKENIYGAKLFTGGLLIGTKGYHARKSHAPRHPPVLWPKVFNKACFS